MATYSLYRVFFLLYCRFYLRLANMSCSDRVNKIKCLHTKLSQEEGRVIYVNMHATDLAWAL